jgi:cell wall-associated NlpC family hydrolase
MPNVDLIISHREAVSALRTAMLEVASEWKGVPYGPDGGDSKQGVDCSHFVYQVLNTARERAAPVGAAPKRIDYRNTFALESSGTWYPVTLPEPGDLVVWRARAGDTSGHVGIIVDAQAGTFIGSQTSTGVAVASYTTGYWANQAGKRFLRYSYFF